MRKSRDKPHARCAAKKGKPATGYMAWVSHQSWYSKYRNAFMWDKEGHYADGIIQQDVAAFEAIKKYLDRWYKPDDPSVVCVVPGCGQYPHTAALLALATSWTVHAVDPMLVACEWGIENLRCHQTYVELFRLTAPRVLIVAVGSHADLNSCVGAVTAQRLAIVVIPCGCEVKSEVMWLGPPARRSYRDKEANRTVLVWECLTPDNRIVSFLRRNVGLAHLGIDRLHELTEAVAHRVGGVVEALVGGYWSSNVKRRWPPSRRTPRKTARQAARRKPKGK